MIDMGFLSSTISRLKQDIFNSAEWCWGSEQQSIQIKTSAIMLSLPGATIHAAGDLVLWIDVQRRDLTIAIVSVPGTLPWKLKRLTHFNWVYVSFCIAESPERFAFLVTYVSLIFDCYVPVSWKILCLLACISYSKYWKLWVEKLWQEPNLW